jgi:hypothetical protein
MLSAMGKTKDYKMQLNVQIFIFKTLINFISSKQAHTIFKRKRGSSFLFNVDT